MFAMLTGAVGAFFRFVKSVYSESDGSGSSTRIHIGLLTAFIIAVGLSFGVLVLKRAITVDQFDSFLGSAATFLVSTAGPLYGVNKLADWGKDKNQQNRPNS